MNRVTLSLVLQLCTFVTWLAAQEVSATTEVKLDNGLKVLLLEIPRTGAVSVGCWYRVGSKDEPLGWTGISHWVEHMNFQGTRNLPGARFRRIIEESGGSPEGYTFLDQTGYFTTVASTTLESMLMLESERMTSSLMNPDVANRQRQALISELQRRLTDPRNLLDVDVTAAALKIHPYRWPTMGWSNDLEAATPERLLDYYRQFYAPNNAILVLVGDFQTRSAIELVNKYFGKISRKPDPHRNISTEPNQEGEHRVKIVREGEWHYLEIAFHAPDILNDDFFGLLVLDAALNGVQGMNLWSAPSVREASKSSRLYKALVEKKLASWVGSSLMPTQNPYLYKLSLRLPDAFQFQPAEEAVYEELDKLKNQGLKDYELAKARNQLVARGYLGQDSLSKIAHQLGFFETIASHRVLGSLEDKINRITNDDIRRVAIKYFSENARTVGWFLSVKRSQKIEVEKLSSRFFPAMSVSLLSPGANCLSDLASSSPAGQHIAETKNAPGASTVAKQTSVGGAVQVIAHPQISIRSQRKILPNGMIVAVAENRLSPSLTIEASIKAGAMRDRDDNAGIAYFVGRMLERGTKARNLSQIAEGFDYLGADLTIRTDYLTTTLAVDGLSRDAPALIQQLSDLIQNPTFPAAEVEKVRTDILTELREDAQDTALLAEQTLRGRIYPAQHPFGRGIKGTIKSVESLQPSDLTAFYKRHYRPDSMMITIAGAVNPDSVVQMVDERLGSWAVSGTRDAFSVPAAFPGLGKGQYTVNTNQGPYCDIVLGFPGISRTNSDYFTMLVINQILGDAQSLGRLGLKLIDQDGLATGIYTSMDASISEGPWSIHIRTTPGQVDRALEAVREEMTKIQNSGATEDELTFAKHRLINLLPTQLESNQGIAKLLSQIQLFELGDNYLNWYPGMVESVTMELVKACLKTKLSADQAAVVIVGPYSPK
jgi:zinc protease